jgi:quercetin dioxygenase-like cupin family protein
MAGGGGGRQTGGAGVGEVSWGHRDELPAVSPFPGITMRLLTGERLMSAWVTLEPNTVVPDHEHPHEQMGAVLEGRLDLTIAGETRRLEPGQTYTIPPGVRHMATTGAEGCLVLDLFAPPREDYLALVGEPEATEA